MRREYLFACDPRWIEGQKLDRRQLSLLGYAPSLILWGMGYTSTARLEMDAST